MKFELKETHYVRRYLDIEIAGEEIEIPYVGPVKDDGTVETVRAFDALCHYIKEIRTYKAENGLPAEVILYAQSTASDHCISGVLHLKATPALLKVIGDYSLSERAEVKKVLTYLVAQ